MRKANAPTEVKKVGIMTISARAASKEIGAADSRFCAAVFLSDDTRKTAGEYLSERIAELVRNGKRPEALRFARLTRPYTRRTAAILAARDVSDMIGAKLAEGIAKEVEAAEEAEKPYIDREAERAKIRSERAAARKAEREAVKMTEQEDKILKAAAEIRAKREAAASAAA